MIEKTVMETRACPLGCKEEDVPILTGHDRIHKLPGEFNIVKCNTCGLMRTNPRPTPNSIGNFYPDNYGPYLGTKVANDEINSCSKNKPPSKPRQFLSRFKDKVFKFNTQRLPEIGPARMLEIGCASGQFLHEMASKGWKVQGVELSATAAAAAVKLGYQVHTGPLETAPQPENAFDLIVGWMVIEHLHEPIAGLKKLREWSKNEGWLVLSVPNSGSIEFQIFKDRWYALHLPNHLFHFTPETLRNVLDESGWTLEKVFHQRVLGNLIASAGYLLCDKGFAKLGERLVKFPEHAGRWNYALYPIAWILSLFGQTGRMTIWARAKS